MKKSGVATGVSKWASFGGRGWVLSILVLCYSGSELGAQESEKSPEVQPSQTRAKTFVPSPSSSEKAASGQIKILEVEYSSKRPDVTINEDKIRQNMRSNKGGVYSQQVVDGDIESLYQTGDYENVQIVTSEMRSDDGERGVRLTVLLRCV